MRKLMTLVARALAGLVGLAGAATVVARVVLERRMAGEIDALPGVEVLVAGRRWCCVGCLACPPAPS